MSHQEHHNHKHHHHHDHGHRITSLSSAFIIATVLNLAFVVVEGGFGLLSHSMGLLSDAGHNLSDVVSLLLAGIAFGLTRVPANKRYTYGYSRSTIIVSLVNACLLLVAVGMIVVESIRKFSHPVPVDGNTIIWVATVGIVINFATALLFLRDRKQDLNVQGAFLHMMMDALVSLGVVVAGIIIKFTGWTVVDPIVGLVVALLILVSTWDLLRKSLRLSLNGVPEEMQLDEVEHAMREVEGVAEVHHLHLWALGTAENALTAHIVLQAESDSEATKQRLRTMLKQRNIAHATLETEPCGYTCPEANCRREQ